MFSLFSRRERIRRARLWRENSPSPAEEAVASFNVRSPKNAIFGGVKYTIDCLRRGFLSFCGRVSRSHTRLTRKNSRFPPTLRSERNSRPAQGNAWQKCDFAALYYTLSVLLCSLRCATTFPCIRALLRAALNCYYKAVKRKISIFNAFIGLFQCAHSTLTFAKRRFAAV